MDRMPKNQSPNVRSRDATFRNQPGSKYSVPSYQAQPYSISELDQQPPSAWDMSWALMVIKRFKVLLTYFESRASPLSSPNT